jgi:hypothetical protein
VFGDRHGYRHRGISLGNRFSHYYDGDDARDGHIQAYSRQGMSRYFVGSLTPSTEPDEPDAKSKESRTYAILEATDGVGLSGGRDEPDAAIRRVGWSVVGLVKNIVGSAARTRRQRTPYLCGILRLSSGSSGL